jgi:hypothetical protein
MRSTVIRTSCWMAACVLCLCSSGASVFSQGEEIYLYADLWPDGDESPGDGVNFYGTGTAELGNCCPGCPDVTIDHDLLFEDNSSMDYSSTTGICSVTVYSYYFEPSGISVGIDPTLRSGNRSPS